MISGVALRSLFKSWASISKSMTQTISTLKSLIDSAKDSVERSLSGVNPFIITPLAKRAGNGGAT
jgi:hypothetical protein